MLIEPEGSPTRHGVQMLRFLIEREDDVIYAKVISYFGGVVAVVALLALLSAVR